MKKKFMVLSIMFVVIAIAFVFISCRKSRSSYSDEMRSDTSISGNLPEKLSNKEVSVLVWTDRVKAEFDKAVKIMEEKYGAIINFTMTTSDQKETKMVTAISAGEAYDCVHWADSAIPNYVIKGILQPIDPHFDLSDPIFQDIIPAMEEYKYKGNYYGISMGLEPPVLFFNKTMFENNGQKTPLEYYKEGTWNWEKLRQIGKAMTKDFDGDGLTDQWGLFISNTQAWRLVIANGGDFVKVYEDGSVELTAKDPKIIEALQFYQDGFIKDKYMGTGVNGQRDFRGKLAMFIAQLSEINKFADAGMKDEWDIAPFPAGPSGVQGVSPGHCGHWGISAGARNPLGGAALIYLRHKTFEEKAIFDYCTEQQKQLIYELRKKVKRAHYLGYGNMGKVVNGLWAKANKGTPIMNIIEEQMFIMQDQIDLTLNR